MGWDGMPSHGKPWLEGSRRRRRRRKGKEPKNVGRLVWDFTESWGGNILIRSLYYLFFTIFISIILMDYCRRVPLGA